MTCLKKTFRYIILEDMMGNKTFFWDKLKITGCFIGEIIFERFIFKIIVEKHAGKKKYISFQKMEWRPKKNPKKPSI